MHGLELVRVAPVVLDRADQVVPVVLDDPAQLERLVGEVAKVEGQPLFAAEIEEAILACS